MIILMCNINMCIINNVIILIMCDNIINVCININV